MNPKAKRATSEHKSNEKSWLWSPPQISGLDSWCMLMAQVLKSAAVQAVIGVHVLFSRWVFSQGYGSKRDIPKHLTGKGKNRPSRLWSWWGLFFLSQSSKFQVPGVPSRSVRVRSSRNFWALCSGSGLPQWCPGFAVCLFINFNQKTPKQDHPSRTAVFGSSFFLLPIGWFGWFGVFLTHKWFLLTCSSSSEA